MSHYVKYYFWYLINPQYRSLCSSLWVRLNYWKNQGDKDIIFNVLANICAILASETCCCVSFSLLNILWHSLISQCTRLYDVPGTQNVGLATQYRFSPLMVQCRSIVFDAGPTLKHIWVIVSCLLWLPYGWRFIPWKATTWITRYIGPILK